MRRKTIVNCKPDRIRHDFGHGAVLVLFMLLILPSIACAGLGDTLTSAVASATVPSASSAYTESTQTDAASRATINQFVATGSNKVFAVTWSGPHRPDLRRLLSSYFGAYIQALAQRRRRSRHVTRIDTGNLVIEMAAYPGMFRGAAWLPALVPTGVIIDDLIP
jgi:Protein of unknown function (DUF2844)